MGVTVLLSTFGQIQSGPKALSMKNLNLILTTSFSNTVKSSFLQAFALVSRIWDFWRQALTVKYLSFIRVLCHQVPWPFHMKDQHFLWFSLCCWHFCSTFSHSFPFSCHIWALWLFKLLQVNYGQEQYVADCQLHRIIGEFWKLLGNGKHKN